MGMCVDVLVCVGMCRYGFVTVRLCGCVWVCACVGGCGCGYVRVGMCVGVDV